MGKYENGQNAKCCNAVLIFTNAKGTPTTQMSLSVIDL